LIDGDGIEPGMHYHEYSDKADMESKLMTLLPYRWKTTAEIGYKHMLDNHTWQVRASQLRLILAEVLGL
jgi:hypothetical protein